MRRLALVSLFATFGSLAQADVSTLFNVDGNAEGWTAAAVNQFTTTLIAPGTVTVAGGVLKSTEVSGGIYVLLAPSAYLGDKSSYAGGTMSYLLADETENTGSFYNLILHGSGLAISYSTISPTVAGRNYSIPLSPAGWKTNTVGGIVDVTPGQFSSVLSNLDVVAINADWTAGGQDRVTLDNVVLAAPVPEPATFAALGLGALTTLRMRSNR